MKKYEIYVGLKDQDMLDELFTAETFASILAAQCRNRQIGFSMTKQLGGYGHKMGYVTETSLRITLMGIEEDEVRQLGKTLMELVNTDTIMITSEDCVYYYM